MTVKTLSATKPKHSRQADHSFAPGTYCAVCHKIWDDAAAHRARLLEHNRAARAYRGKPCPSSCSCMCHDTGGSYGDHPNGRCPGKDPQ